MGWVAAQSIITGKQVGSIISDVFYSALLHKPTNGQSFDLATLENDIVTNASILAQNQAFQTIFSKIKESLNGLDLNKITTDQVYFNSNFFKTMLPVIDGLSASDQQTLVNAFDEIITGIVDELAIVTNGPGENSDLALTVHKFASANQILPLQSPYEAFVGVGAADSVIYDGSVVQYKIVNYSGQTVVTASDIGNGKPYTGVLTNVSSLKFDDGTLYLNPSNVGATVYYIDQAASGATPASSVYTAWVNAVSNAKFTQIGIIDNYMTTTQYANKFGGLSNGEFIKTFMHDLFNWTPDQSTVAAWSGYLDNGLGRDQAMKSLIDYAIKVDLAGLQHPTIHAAGLWTT